MRSPFVRLRAVVVCYSFRTGRWLRAGEAGGGVHGGSGRFPFRPGFPSPRGCCGPSVNGRPGTGIPCGLFPQVAGAVPLARVSGAFSVRAGPGLDRVLAPVSGSRPPRYGQAATDCLRRAPTTAVARGPVRVRFPPTCSATTDLFCGSTPALAVDFRPPAMKLPFGGRATTASLSTVCASLRRSARDWAVPLDYAAVNGRKPPSSSGPQS